MSKRQARRLLRQIKHGLTAKEFTAMCQDMGTWFDIIQPDPVLLEIYSALAERKTT